MEQGFFIHPFQDDVWRDNYRNTDESIEGTFHRVAKEAMQFEERPRFWANRLKEAMLARRISLGGRIVANAGTSYSGTANFNCYGAQRSTGRDVDSIECIYDDLTNAAQILKTEGGVGFNFNHLRPTGTHIKGIGSATPGVIKFMELYDKSSEIITRGFSGDKFQVNGNDTKKRIRKGAMMAMLDIRHPDIEYFITAKSVANYLERFNMSVILTDIFMQAVIADADWELWFPDIHHDSYEEEWKGDFDDWEAKGYPKVVYKTAKAKELFELIMQNTYTRNEPGVYFIDAAQRYNNLAIIGQKITGTNPCGEIGMIGDAGTFKWPMEAFDNWPMRFGDHMRGYGRVNTETNNWELDHIGDICNLGNINLVSYAISDENGWRGFDWVKFENDISLLVRTLDNLIDVSNYPLEGIRASANLRRKIGIGVMGYGSLLFMMGLRYGSDDANYFTETLLNFKTNAEYAASAELAKEKGPFPMWDVECINGGYLANGHLATGTLNLIKEHGLRNAQLSTCAPTGTTGIFMGLVSGGMEPVIQKEYARWITWSHRMTEVGKKMPDFERGDYSETDDFKIVKIAGEEILESLCGDYRIDKSRGLIKRIPCEDFGWTWVKDHYTPEQIAVMEEDGVFTTSMDLTVSEHANVFSLFSGYVDNSISKTINLRKDYPFEEFEELFIDMWRQGARGCTTYREGTMVGVLEVRKEEKERKKTVRAQQRDFLKEFAEHDGDVLHREVKLPEEYPAKGFILKSEGRKWYLHVAFKDKQMTKPFALFCSTNNYEKNVLTFTTLDMLEQLARNVGLPGTIIDDTKEKIAGQKNVTKITRMVGMLLRHNVKIVDIVVTLNNIEDAYAGSFVHRIKKFLMQYVQDDNMEIPKCPMCGGRVELTEGCFLCTECGGSKC